MVMKQEIDRRTFIRRSSVAIGGIYILGGSGILAACTTSDTTESTVTTQGSGGQTTRTLHLAILEEVQQIDPDIFYDGEGLQITLSAYEGLVQYGENSEIAPALAESWEVSDDGLTYTFHLRDGVKFHDGSDLTASSMIRSFERRREVGAGPAYMVAGITAMDAPDESTFVIQLETPSNALLYYFACPWRPFAVSPTAVEEHEADGDLAQGWLASNTAGTGPYRITEWVPGVRYSLEAFPDYWGGEAEFANVEIEVISDITTQRLRLENGELDAVTHGLPIEDVVALGQRDNLQVFSPPSPARRVLWMNAVNGIMADKTLRQAVVKAVDREALVDAVYQDFGEVPYDFYSPMMFEEGIIPYEPDYDPSELNQLVESLPSTTVDLAYVDKDGVLGQRMTELIGVQLQEAGLDVTVRGIPSAQAFSLFEAPSEDRPDLLYWTFDGDALHLDAVYRTYMRTDAGPLNWANFSNSELDELMDEAVAARSDEERVELYVRLAEVLREEAWMVPLLDLKEGCVVNSRLTGVIFDQFFPTIIDVDELSVA